MVPPRSPHDKMEDHFDRPGLYEDRARHVRDAGKATITQAEARVRQLDQIVIQQRDELNKQRDDIAQLEHQVVAYRRTRELARSDLVERDRTLRQVEVRERRCLQDIEDRDRKLCTLKAQLSDHVGIIDEQNLLLSLGRQVMTKESEKVRKLTGDNAALEEQICQKQAALTEKIEQLRKMACGEIGLDFALEEQAQRSLSHIRSLEGEIAQRDGQLAGLATEYSLRGEELEKERIAAIQNAHFTERLQKERDEAVKKAKQAAALVDTMTKRVEAYRRTAKDQENLTAKLLKQLQL